MVEIDEQFIQALTECLGRLPKVKHGQERHKSWMSAEQIADWWYQQYHEDKKPEDIDEMLRTWWLASPTSRQIRPAKYPHRDTTSRLWGHVQRVRKLSPEELRLFRMDPLIEVEAIKLEPSAPRFFLSYAAPDLHYAARVRLALGTNGVRSWMYSAEIHKGKLIVEGVQTALSAAQRILALITPLSISSAWMQTEIHTGRAMGKPVLFVFDGSQVTLLKLLASWRPPTSYHGRHFDDTLLLQLLEEYRRFNSQRRVKKYEDSARDFLHQLIAHPKKGFEYCVYPRRPQGWHCDTNLEVRDFEEVIPSYLA